MRNLLGGESQNLGFDEDKGEFIMAQKKPRVLVIGGTKGIGKEVVDHFGGDSISRNEPRDEGFDIRNPVDRKKIAYISDEYDICINHAYSDSDEEPIGGSQAFMLKEIYDRWKETNWSGYLFNSSSDATKIYRMKSGKNMMYSAMKASVNVVSHYISRDVQEGNVRMRYTNIIWGMLDTEKSRSKPHYNNGVRGEDICKVIETLYYLPEDCLIPEFVMEARFLK
jgi:NAD(P)-dependent dehydrogenase (short-subunit alcohol dehydrogenase family)